MNLLQADHLTKKLGSFHLNNISFTLPPGYICGLVGQNGAGKTTLLHLILGLYNADEGTILMNGMNYETQEKQIHDMIGTVLVEDLLNPSMTLIQNADWYGKYYSNYNIHVWKTICPCFIWKKRENMAGCQREKN
ncbi:MAG: ATP-binding cassette domain-containing protein [Lachnospiraceae bacterium]|nr:ATP-binding cassette domain-containing protein [Lachnospiraceae bacterium]